MKTILFFALLAIAATMATAQFNPSGQFQTYPGQQQQPFIQQQQLQFLQQQQQFFQLLQQQLNPCKQFLVQQCSPVAAVPFQRSQVVQQGICHSIQQQCCRQLAQIPEQHRCPAIHSVVQAIIMPQQQQQFFLPPQQQQQGFVQPQGQQMSFGFFQPQQQAQFEGMRAFALQALPAMCDVYIPPHCSVATTPFGGL